MIVGLLLVGMAGAVTLDDHSGAESLVRGGAAVLDARSTSAFLLGHVPGAVAVDWRIGVVGGQRSGLLGAPATVAAAFADLGVWRDRAVLVVGDWTASWGEEGRIAWEADVPRDGTFSHPRGACGFRGPSRRRRADDDRSSCARPSGISRQVPG